MIKLHYITNGDMNIELENMIFGKHEEIPVENVKSFNSKERELSLKSNNINHFTNWGIVELFPEDKKLGIINVSIDSNSWGRIATAQIMIEKNKNIIINNNFQSEKKELNKNSKKSNSVTVPF
ncbi:MAG: hypothetical protein AABZ74_07310 [Cyanobacteriota bacterium]